MLCPTARNSLWNPCGIITYSLVSTDCILLHRLQCVHHWWWVVLFKQVAYKTSTDKTAKLGQSVSNIKHVPMSWKESYSLQVSWKHTTFYEKSIYICKRQRKIHCAFAYTTISVVWQYKSGPNICINEYKMCMSKSSKEKHNLLNHIISQNDEMHMKNSKVLKNHYKKCHEVQQQHGINMNFNSICFSQCTCKFNCNAGFSN
jgi:hypothetical protein